MAMITDKMVRGETQWVKITRNNKDRTFTFARGNAGNFQAHDIETFTFKFFANWKEAIEFAELKIKIFA